MKRIILSISIITFIFLSCNQDNELKNKRVTEYENIYFGLKNDNNFENFIGFHIVRRADGNQFFYRNLKEDSSFWQPPLFYEDNNEELDKETKLFFKKNPQSKLQFDIMLKYGIKAVISDNYNPETNQLEYREKGGLNFNSYELLFLISDSLAISHINFDLDKYLLLIKNNYNIVEKLDSNWFILKRL